MARSGSLKLLSPMMVLIALHALSFVETSQTLAQEARIQVSDEVQAVQDEQPSNGDHFKQPPPQEDSHEASARRIVASEVEAGPAESPAQASKTPSPHNGGEDMSSPVVTFARQQAEDPTLHEQEGKDQKKIPVKTGSPPTDSLDGSAGDPVAAHKFAGAAPEILKLIKSGVLRIGMCTIDQPPFHITNPNGEFVGFDINLAHKLAEALGVKVEFVKAPDWDSTIQLVLDDKADIMLSNMTLLPERAAKLYCSKPYARIRQCMLLNRILLARAEGKGLTTLRQIFSQYDNRTLIIQKGAAYETSAGNMFPQAKIETTESWEEILQKILSREAFATISDEIEIKKQMRTVQSMELTAVTLKGMFDLMVIGISRKLPQLLEFINTFIDVESIECDLDQVN